LAKRVLSICGDESGVVDHRLGQPLERRVLVLEVQRPLLKPQRRLRPAHVSSRAELYWSLEEIG
jgi:hypothetical protein